MLSHSQTLGECHKRTESANRKRPKGPVRRDRLSSAPLCSKHGMQRPAVSPAVRRTLGRGVFTEEEHRLWRDSGAYLAKLAENDFQLIVKYLCARDGARDPEIRQICSLASESSQPS